MTKEILERRIEFVEAQIGFLEEQMENMSPADKGYMDVVKAYNDWGDTYTRLVDELDHFDISASKEKAEKRKDAIDLGLRVAELACKVAVPVIGVTTTLALAKLSYIQDSNMVLCNGRIFPMAKDVIKLATTKI